MKKILCFKIKSVCYDSYSYFMDSLTEMLGQKAVEVEFFDVKNESLEQLERLLGNNYDAMFDFNSDLPKLKMDDDSYFLDHINAPFYDIILDHPLYHHDMLKQTIKNFHVICLDFNHLNYIKEYYPHILSVHVTFMTGDSHKPFIPYEKRSNELLFTGTYTPSSDVLYAISNTPPFLANDTKEIIELLLADEHMTIEQAIRSLSTYNDHILPETFPLHVQSQFLADTYVRALKREQLLTYLIKEGFDLTLCGYGWDSFEPSHATNVRQMKSIPFADTFSLMGDSKMVLNLMPNFKNGTHDRIFSSMQNQCLTITDSSICLKEYFTTQKELIYYSTHDFDSLCKELSFLNANPDVAKGIAERGYQKASTQYTWENVADLFLREIL